MTATQPYQHRFILEPYKGPGSRYRCPACGHNRTFSRYIDQATGAVLAEHVGRCNREDRCGYHFTPKEFREENPGSISLVPDPFQKTAELEISRPVSFLPFELMEQSVMNHRRCDLYPFMAEIFSETIADELCESYLIGSNSEGHTCFWQVDVDYRIRQAKVIRYMADGHRNKGAGVIFTGKKILNDQEANLQQCFFGEHLLAEEENRQKTIVIVESEKTAAISSKYFPEYLWLATGGKHGAKWTQKEVAKVLAGRKIILMPDINAFDSWKAKGELLSQVARCRVYTSDLLEKRANQLEREQGLDVADFLLKEERMKVEF